MVERLRIAVGKGLEVVRSRIPRATSLARITSSPLVLAMVPATSASSTIDSRRSCSASSSAIGAHDRPFRPAGRARQGSSRCILPDPPKPAPFPRTAGCWRRSTTAGRSSVDRIGRCQLSPARDRGCLAVERNRPRFGKFIDQLLDRGCGRPGGSTGRGFRGGWPTRSRPTARCAVRPGARAALHKASAARSSPIAAPSSRQN